MKTAWSGVRAMTIASLAAAALAPYAAQAAQPDDDPDKVARWLDFKEGTFKGRAIDPHGECQGALSIAAIDSRLGGARRPKVAALLMEEAAKLRAALSRGPTHPVRRRLTKSLREM